MGTASHVFIAEMKSRGIESRTHRLLVEGVESLAEEFKSPVRADWFVAAQRLQSNFYNGDLDDWNFDLHLRRVHGFVKRVIKSTS